MDPNLASNSSDEASYCSMFEDDCDSEMNKWFELFFFNVDQAVFYDKKLSENYEKIDKECKVWNSLFKLKKVDLTDPELKRTLFTSEKLGKKLQLVEETCSDIGQHLRLRREKSFPQEDEPKFKPFGKSKAKDQTKAINRYFELNNEFDKITLMNQLKQDYIRRHVLNSSPKSDGNSSPHHSLAVYSPSVLFPVTTNSSLSRRKQMMIEQNKLNEDAASSCLYFYPGRRKEHSKLKKQQTIQPKEEKAKVRTVKSIMKIDQGNTSNLILNSEQIIQPSRLKTPLVLPPLHKNDLPQRFDRVTLHDQNQAIVQCDKLSNQCSLNLRKGQELRLSAFNKRPMMLSIKNELFK